jgi:hypothetical protein
MSITRNKLLRWSLLSLGLVGIFALSTCKKQGDGTAGEPASPVTTTRPGTGPKGLPKAEASSLWQHLTDAPRYTDWRYFPGRKGMYPGRSPHGAFLKLYVNDIAYQAAKQGEPMPDGAILVKENYGKDKTTLMAITPMYKKRGYNPQAGDWFWAKYGPNGKVMASGKVQSCIGCHEKAQGGSYLFTKAP